MPTVKLQAPENMFAQQLIAAVKKVDTFGVTDHPHYHVDPINLVGEMVFHVEQPGDIPKDTSGVLAMAGVAFTQSTPLESTNKAASPGAGLAEYEFVILFRVQSMDGVSTQVGADMAARVAQLGELLTGMQLTMHGAPGYDVDGKPTGRWWKWRGHGLVEDAQDTSSSCTYFYQMWTIINGYTTCNTGRI